MDKELEALTQQGVSIGVLRAKFHIARWFLSRKPDEPYMTHSEIALQILNLKIPDDETTE